MMNDDLVKKLAEFKEHRDALESFKEDYRIMVEKMSREVVEAMYGCPIAREVKKQVKDWLKEQD